MRRIFRDESSVYHFDHELSPKRIHSLLPQSRLIIILRDSIHRAYSWFQHQIAHSNEIALKYKFIEVLENNFSDKTTRLAVSKLRSRCIELGLYSGPDYPIGTVLGPTKNRYQNNSVL